MNTTALKLIETPSLTINPAEMAVRWKGRTIRFTATQFKVIYFLASTPGRIRSRSECLDFAWGIGIFIEERSVDSFVKRIRARFKACDPTFDQIDTFYQIGYSWRKE